jgi:hypothetical protein
MANKIVLVALIALLVTFGCVGGNQATNNTNAGAGMQVAGNAGSNNAAAGAGTGNAAAGGNVAAGTQNNTAGAGSSSANSGSSSSSSSSSTNPLDAILANVGQADYKVTYDVASSSGENIYTSTMVQYVKGTKMRYDSETSGIKSESFFLDSKLYTCMDTGSGFLCYESASSTEESSPTGAADLKSSEDNYIIQPLPDRTIAGIVAKCFNMKAKSGSETDAVYNAEYCVTTDGIIVYVKSDSSTMTATAVERGIADSVFTLPATPTKMGQ